MTSKEPKPVTLQNFIDHLNLLKTQYSLPDDLPVYIRLGHKEGTTTIFTVPLITIEIPQDKEYIAVGSQAPLDEIVKQYKIFDSSEGDA